MREFRHCIVTPEVAPAFKNGGVGTNAYHLAQFIGAREGEMATILCTRDCPGEPGDWQRYYREQAGADFYSLADLPEPYAVEGTRPVQLGLALRVYWWLRDRRFDVVHLMNYEAPGFVCVQARRLGISFPDTHFVTICNSPIRWLKQGQLQPGMGNASELVLEHMERYCVEHSDTVLSPSRSLIEWMRAHGWAMAPDTRWLPTYSPVPEGSGPSEFGRQHVVFFGRLETRKGLPEFLEAVSRLPDRLNGAFPSRLRVSLLGRINRGAERDFEHLLQRAFPERENPGSPFEVEVLTELDHSAAMEFLARNRTALYVHPSRLDNFPNAVREVQLRGLPQLCADAPGVAEMFACRSRLFEPTAPGLLDKLEEAFLGRLGPSQPSCPAEVAEAMRPSLYEEIRARRERPRPVRVEAARPARVSVCVTHHNLGAYLPEALAALRRQTYGNMEVIVVDDGSTDAESLAAFRACGDRYGGLDGWRFVETPNRGLCGARNFAVGESTGEHLIFVDADNIPLPAMVETLADRLRAASLDCLTCYLYCFDDGTSAIPSDLRLLAAFPGGCLSASLYRNTLGDANMIVRRSAFDAVGGFRSGRDEASSDRALLIRLLRAGFRLDCTPECLFAYRHRGNSMSRSGGSSYWRQHAVVEAFTEGMEPWLADALLCQSVGESFDHRMQRRVDLLADKHRTEREKRRERDRKADERYATLLRWRHNLYIRFGRFLGIVERDF